MQDGTGLGGKTRHPEQTTTRPDHQTMEEQSPLTSRTGWRVAALRFIVPPVLTVILSVITVFNLAIPSLETNLLAAKRETIKELTNTAWKLLNDFDQRVTDGELSLDEAQSMAAEHVRTLRYGPEAKDYFWINDMRPVMVMHPYRTDLEGTDISDFSDPNGKRLFVEFVQVVEAYGAGYVDYQWQWKDDSSRIVPKLSYVKGYRPWGWIVGTGIYLEDVREEIALVTRRLLFAFIGILLMIAALSAYMIVQASHAERIRRVAEEEHAKLSEELRQAQKMEAIGLLAGGVAHDFNNLLTGILGNAQLLTMALPADTENGQCAADIIRSSQRAADLTQQLLAFSRKGKFRMANVDLHQIIDEVVRLLSRSIDRRVVISQDLAATVPIVHGDPSQLQNAVLNLGVNARDAMPDGGRLTFATRNIEVNESFQHDFPEAEILGEYVELKVTDTGCGISSETREHIFEPFFTTKGVGKGTGLGLAGVFGCVKSHNGVIKVDSEVTKGSTFTILLPVSGESTATAPANLDEDLIRGEGRVLIVDDEEAVRKTAARALRNLGYEVTTCADGVKAIAYFKDHYKEVDLVVLDLIMPKMSGGEVFQFLKKIDPEVRVLIASGFTREGTADTLIKHGALGFINKPFKIEALSHAVARYLPTGNDDADRTGTSRKQAGGPSLSDQT